MRHMHENHAITLLRAYINHSFSSFLLMMLDLTPRSERHETLINTDK